MTTVTDAIAAATEAFANAYDWSEGIGVNNGRAALVAAWPILSAPLRELVDQWRRDGVTLRETDLSYANCTLMDASVLEELIEQTDKELGCE